MKKLFVVLSWFAGILLLVVFTMLTIGLVYKVPEATLFTDVFKALFTLMVPTLLVWLGLFVYNQN